MEYWEITKKRAQFTYAAWNQYAPATKVSKQTPAEFAALIDQFEPAAQARVAAQDDFDAAYRTAQSSLLIMRLLGTKVPAMIENNLEDDPIIMKDVDDLYGVSPRTETTIIKRVRSLVPVWERANAALAALTPPLPAVVKLLGGTQHTVVMLKDLVDDYGTLAQAAATKQEALEVKRGALRMLDRKVDQLNKRFYKTAKATYEEGTEMFEALKSIPVEGGTPAPDPIEINMVTQGGEEGLQVLVSYLTGGGAHATTKLVQWQIVGINTGFDQSAVLDPSGNALGPFEEGQTIKIITEVKNSAGTRTTAPRTIVIGAPIV